MKSSTPCLALAAAAVLAACSNASDGEAVAPEQTERGAETQAAEPAPAPEASASAASGVLPLETGVYVLEGTDCGAPANAGLRIYDGAGISGSSTRVCHAEILSQDGAEFSVSQSCVNTYDGSRTSAPQELRIERSDSFTLVEGDEEGRFRLCPAEELPDYLRERVSNEPPLNDGGASSGEDGAPARENDRKRPRQTAEEAGEPSPGSCYEELGGEGADALVDQCLQISPATRPPCHVQNSCELIRDEIARGCGFGDAQSNPAFCSEYD